MITRYFLAGSFTILLLSCSNDDESDADQIEDCETGKYYGKMIWNHECWVSERVRFSEFTIDPSDAIFSIEIERTLDFYQEIFVFTIPENTPLSEKIYFSPTDDFFKKSVPLYFYAQGDGVITNFSLPENYDPEQNYFVVDGINQDSTEVTGSFRCFLANDNETTFPETPETIKMVNGKFKLQRTHLELSF